MKRIKIELDEDVVNALISRKTVGKTYSDIVRALLKIKEVLPEFCVKCIEKEHCIKRNREECFKENKGKK